MKIKRFLTTALTATALSALLSALLLAACEQPALPGPAAPGMGAVTVTAAAPGLSPSLEGAASALGAARTVVPDAGFDKIELTFTPTVGGGDAIVRETATLAPQTMYVPEGTYTLTARGWKNSAVIAEGTAAASVVIVSEAPETVAVILAPKDGGGTGVFGYNVTLPKGAVGVLTLTGQVEKTFTLTAASPNPNTGTEDSLPSGIYRLALDITFGTGKAGFANEAVYLYPGLISTFTRDFSSVNLIKPEKPATAAEALAAIKDWPKNDAEHPYTLDLGGYDLAAFNKDGDPLGAIFAALDGKYVELDLSGCDWTEIPDSSGTTYNKDRIVSVTLPDTLTTIGEEVFYACTSLRSIDLPTTLNTLGHWAFASCRALESINLSDTQLTTIGEGTFMDCQSLASVDLPDTLTIIGEAAFGLCKSLVSIDLPDTLIVIGGSAFGECTSLASIVLPNKVENIVNLAFSGCTSLTEVVSLNPVPPILLGSGAFGGTSLTAIYVPDTSVTAYKEQGKLTTSGWSVYADIIKPMSARPSD